MSDMNTFDPDDIFDTDEFPPVRTDVPLNMALPDAPPPEDKIKLSSEEVDAAWLECLRRAGVNGVSPAELATATGLSRSAVHRRIETAMNEGRIERVRSGVYVLVRTGSTRAR